MKEVLREKLIVINVYIKHICINFKIRYASNKQHNFTPQGTSKRTN